MQNGAPVLFPVTMEQEEIPSRHRIRQNPMTALQGYEELKKKIHQQKHLCKFSGKKKIIAKHFGEGNELKFPSITDSLITGDFF